MLTCKEVPCVENVQIAYCANYRNIPGVVVKINPNMFSLQ